MGQLATLITPAGKLARDYGETLLKGIEDSKFARFPVVEGQTIETNHPAFVYGHLGTYPAKVLTLLGADPKEIAAPEGFEDLFSKHATCQDDPDGTIYPSMDTVVNHFFRATDIMLERLPEISDEAMLKAHEGALASRFENVGGFVTFLISAHVNIHFGQVSAWRRCMGMGRA